MSGTITMIQAVQITGICMGIVFATLFFISILIDFLKVVLTNEFGKKKNDIPGNDTGNQELEKTVTDIPARGPIGKKPEELTTDDEIAVAMVAAIEASEGNKDAKIRVVAVREV